MESTKGGRIPLTARARAAVMAVSFALACVGCTSRRPAEGSLVVALESMPQNLDPRFATDAASSRIDELVFRSLTRSDESQQRVPDLAEDWDLEDARTVRFRLRSDAVFHDGTALT
ncbi:MAG: hypothetical protein ACREQ9_26230, partial [Candidatus Binatia bacterium]